MCFMLVSDLSFRKACLSSLLHDLRVAYNCLSYHAKNRFNPYSQQVCVRLQSLADAVNVFYSACLDEFSNLNIDD